MCLYINFELPSREGASHSKRSKAGGSCTSSGFAGVEPVKIKKRKAQPPTGQKRVRSKNEGGRRPKITAARPSFLASPKTKEKGPAGDKYG